MPTIIQGSFSQSLNTATKAMASQDMGYKYPFKLDLRPGSKIHNKIVERVMAMARDSYSQISKRHPDWNETDKTLSAYIPLSDYEKSIKKKDPTRPISIVVPYSYAALETILAYMVKAFLNNKDVFQYEGVGPEDTVAAILLQLLVNQQVRHFKSVLDIHTGFRDGITYGFHASAVSWEEKWGRKPVIQESAQYSSMGTYLGVQRTKQNVPTLLFEGNRVTPIDPYKCLPDPNVSIHRVQDGRFFGWYDFVSINELLAAEKATGAYFNMKFVKTQEIRQQYSSIFSPDASKRSKQDITKGQTVETNDAIVTYMYAQIIPQEWGLPGDPDFNADGSAPEIWSFAIANDMILIDLGPLDLNHQSYPVAINSPDFDGYSCAPISKMEMDAGLQQVLNFMFNSHVTNTRKAIHDMFVVDPSLISMTDLKNPEPGKYIRMRRTAWGRGVDKAIQQLAVSDVTRGNIQDAGFIMQLMNRVGATDDAAQGVSRRGGPDRVTAAEFNGTFGSNISRLDRLAVITSLQYMHDLGFLHASHTQQLMSMETYVKQVGDWPQELMDEYGALGAHMNVSPFDILADVDVVTKDGSEAHEDTQILNFWMQTLPAVLQQPLLYNVLSVTQIFKHVARLAGEKNVGSFIAQGGQMNAKLVGDAAAHKMAQEGNALKIDQIAQLMGASQPKGGE